MSVKENLELKSCPFCGGMPLIEKDVHHHSKFGIFNVSRVACQECGIKTEWYDFHPYAMKHWNKRLSGNDKPTPQSTAIAKIADKMEYYANTYCPTRRKLDEVVNEWVRQLRTFV